MHEYELHNVFSSIWLASCTLDELWFEHALSVHRQRVDKSLEAKIEVPYRCEAYQTRW